MMKQKLALLLTALLLLTGCSSGGSGDTADGQDDGELETIDVVLDWYPNAVHAFLYEAEEKGYFAEEGLQVNILFPSNASDPLTMTAAGRADIGFYYQEDTIIAKANEDVPVKVLGAVVQQPISIVCALAEKNIKTPEDLIGKTIGYSGTRFGEVAVGQMLETVGATLDDVELIDVGFDLMSAMTTGNVDATFGCFINHEVPALEEEGFAVDYMEVMDYGVPNYYALMLVTGEDQLEANRDKYTRFLRACQKGFADMQADPEEALGLLLANQDEENFPLTESVERRSFGAGRRALPVPGRVRVAGEHRLAPEGGHDRRRLRSGGGHGGPAGGVRHGRWRMPRDRHWPGSSGPGRRRCCPASWRCWNRSAPSTAAPAMRRATPP